MKTCEVCGKTKSRTDFYKENSKDGRQRLCKVCSRARASAYVRNHRKEINAKCREKYHTDSKYREGLKASKQKWEKKNREKINITTRAWHIRNPHKSSEYHTRYRTRKAQNGGNHTAIEFGVLCKKYGNECLACGIGGKLTVDHVVPIAKGGTNDISNIQPLCMSCNASKQDKTIDYRR